ncbi:hypothetical protein D4764_22G0006870 [Takifugu flavidus]|uniref:Uncharacterized protein n=1 Tax=Takifugu flavidus TaxID=433684 RepID=A0A5C6NGB7_9TELE|nr:hypothetical protein D4764_22G0006870 [Takifugu flavidus]
MLGRERGEGGGQVEDRTGRGGEVMRGEERKKMKIVISGTSSSSIQNYSNYNRVSALLQRNPNQTYFYGFGAARPAIQLGLRWRCVHASQRSNKWEVMQIRFLRA